MLQAVTRNCKCLGTNRQVTSKSFSCISFEIFWVINRFKLPNRIIIKIFTFHNFETFQNYQKLWNQPMVWYEIKSPWHSYLLFFQKIKTLGVNKCTYKYWGHELMLTKRFNSENNNNNNLFVITTTYNIITILTILIVKILLTMVL